jgi:dGTPase
MQWEKLINPARFEEKQPVSKRDQQSRSIFEQDFDRIIFSYPFRCLQDKTQVFPLPKTDFVHTRLTHSLEVSSVGRSLGKKVGKIIIERNPKLIKKGINQFEIGAIVASAALAHDIGNPPFGHSGEDAISEYFLENDFGKSLKAHLKEKEWSDLIKFEGNAQGFRLLTNNKFQGLKVTFATLAAFSKYPRESLLDQADTQRKSQKKYGFFQSEKDKFQETAIQTGLLSLSDTELAWCRHPLAFLVEAADDICYSIIDLEDGCNLNLVSIDEVTELLSPIIADKFNYKKFKNIKLKREKVSLLRAMAIAELVEQVAQSFIDQEQELMQGKFDKALTEVIQAGSYLKHIIKISVEKIYKSTPVLEKETAGFEVLSGLIDSYLRASFDFYQHEGKAGKKNTTILNLFPDDLKAVLNQEHESFYSLILACLDHITLMTDSYALEMYRKIKGISIPGY